jgi:hypothetical protein
MDITRDQKKKKKGRGSALEISVRDKAISETNIVNGEDFFIVNGTLSPVAPDLDHYPDGEDEKTEKFHRMLFDEKKPIGEIDPNDIPNWLKELPDDLLSVNEVDEGDVHIQRWKTDPQFRNRYNEPTEDRIWSVYHLKKRILKKNMTMSEEKAFQYAWEIYHNKRP